MSEERAGRVRWAGVVAGGLLVATVVGAVGYTVDTVKDAARDAGAPVWAFPEAAADSKQPSAGATGLARALVPYRPDGWTRGPDLGEFGADVALSGAQATALSKESLSGLPRSQRREVEKEIERRHITGVAMRSYASTGGFHDGEQMGALSLTVVLTRMKDRAAVRSGAADQKAFFEALDVFRAGPRIEGHKDARCYRLPADSDEGLDMMFCAAYRGDVLVSATGEGVRPFGAKSVAALLTEQLDRIAEPGEAV
ncbi:hypothetical protein RI578_21740 [Streptomyces sp. BB1-1-1]|uniref:hypothetical protein n=1 Tax=Streptomyces sp. BB1-1-1 TaxID=3074430 RepID=UPI0028781015|nr:hypothetical protein [Streptomyces sp. BB1-1-1]WND36739.1 hypothetical protein RI578_21740 [Streptomyces sp. BB1-1-1]